jgi:hypothetical protein
MKGEGRSTMRRAAARRAEVRPIASRKRGARPPPQPHSRKHEAQRRGLIDRFGHAPKGARSDYLSRSQPPFFSLRVELLAASADDGVLVAYLRQMEAEYACWMHGAAHLAL